MAQRYSAGIAERPAPEAARRIILTLACAARSALSRLEEGKDGEALHDFRVSVRRMRSVMRSLRAQLKGCKPKELSKRLKKLQRATGAGRDAEVQLDWLQQHAEDLAGEDLPGFRRFQRLLKRRKAEGYETACSQVLSGFGEIGKLIRKRFSRYEVRIQVSADPSPSLREVVGRQALQATAELHRRLALVHGVEQDTELHAARIAGKRLRYLLEPLCAEHDGVAAAVSELKKLQDALGAMHDKQVLFHDLTDALNETKKPAPAKTNSRSEQSPKETVSDATRGLASLRNLCEREKIGLFSEIKAQWLGEANDHFHERLQAVAEQLLKGRPQS